MLRIFTPVKIQRPRPGLNPQTWVPEASMLTTRPPKPSFKGLILKVPKYSRVSFFNGSFYDHSLLRPLSSWTEHSRLVVNHCRNSSVLSLLSALLALFRCACFSSFSILVQFFWVDCGFFYPPTPIKKTEKKKKSKQMTLHSFMMSSEPPPGPTSTK